MEQMLTLMIIILLQVLWYFDCVFTAIFALEVVVKVRNDILRQFCVDFTVFVSLISLSWYDTSKFSSFETIKIETMILGELSEFL